MSLMAASAGSAAQERVYFGTYTGPKSKGIYTSAFDPAAGRLGDPELAAETKHPTFIGLHPKRGFLYAVGEIGDFRGQKTGAVSAFAIEAGTGRLRLVNQQPSGGGGPCHLSVDKTGRCVLVANYGSGSIAALPIGPDGSLGEARSIVQHHGSSVNPRRQEGPHAHFILPDPRNRHALVCDLGLDKVLIYDFDPAKASLTPSDSPAAPVSPGAGPRHLEFDPAGRRVYVVNEMGSSVTAFVWDRRTARLREMRTVSTLPESFKGESTCAEIQVHPSGRYVYASNRGHDSIAVFNIDPETGELTARGHAPTQGKTPRHFAIHPSGKWLLAENQNSGTVVVFKINVRTGELTPTGQVSEVPSPVCAVFASGK